MTTEKNDSLHEYYSASKRLPTHAAFSSRDQLSAYERQRASLFQEHLFIPLRTFRGARVVEFGPDSGENSLVFGLWGSSLTLVEPNPLAWPAQQPKSGREQTELATPSEAKMKLIRRPVKPKRNPVLLLKLSNPKYETWRIWLDGVYWEIGARD